MAELPISAADIDSIKAIIFLVAFFINRQAAIVILAHAVNEYCYSSSLNGFWTALVVGLFYAELAASNITIKLEIRYLFLSISVVNWLCAADIHFSKGATTYFEICYPYLINGLDVLVLYYLLPKGSIKNAGRFVGSGFRALANL